LEQRNDHVPMNVPLKNAVKSTALNLFGTIGTLEREKIGDKTRGDPEAELNEPLAAFSASKLVSSENRVPMFQLFQNSKNVS
jgi:hypothetical protein